MPCVQELCKSQNYKITLLNKVALLISQFFLNSSHITLPSNSNLIHLLQEAMCGSSLPSELPQVSSAHLTLFLLHPVSHTFLFLSYYIHLCPCLNSPTSVNSRRA